MDVRSISDDQHQIHEILHVVVARPISVRSASEVEQ